MSAPNSAEQLAIAWVLARAPEVVPAVGARTRNQLAEAVPARSVAGTRYDAYQMKILDSERPSSPA